LLIINLLLVINKTIFIQYQYLNCNIVI